MIHYRPTVCEIDLNAFRHNLRQAQQLVSPNTTLLAIVKANAYGHGMVQCARAAHGLGVRNFGVATVEEGLELRQAGMRGDVFILGGLLSNSLQEFREYNLKPVIHHLDDFCRLGDFSKETNHMFDVHLKVDTGMGRLGFSPSEMEGFLEKVKKYPLINIEGVMTHLARADEPEQEPTERQFILFQRLKNILSEKGIKVPFYHLANSAAILDKRVQAGEWARPGIMLYGAYPNPRHLAKCELKPVMTLKTKVLTLKNFPQGSPISYGGTFVTNRQSRIAILPIGYADGYPRLVSNRGVVLVRGKRAPVVGRVCMDLTMVDVTDIPDVMVGDEVILIGCHGTEQIRAEEVAAWAETISYELFCGISARVPRVYVGM